MKSIFARGRVWNQYIYISIIGVVLLFIPNISFAMLSGASDFLKAIGGLMNSIIAIMVGLGIVYFFWGMGQFILHAGEEQARSDGKQKMIWGVIAIFVMVSIYGIINFIGSTLGITASSGTTYDCPNSPPGWISTDGVICFDPNK